MPNAVDRVIDDALNNNRIVGTEVIALRDGAVIYRRAAGYFDREAGTAMPENAIYRLASVTKPIVAATALAMMDKGMLHLGDRVSAHLPWFRPQMADGSEAAITIHHLLTHTAGLAYGYPGDPAITLGLADTDLGLEDTFSRVARQELLFAPGTGWSYSCAIDVLGAVLAQVHGGTLGGAVAAHVAGPLGMEETGFFVADQARLTVPYSDATRPPRPMSEFEIIIGEDGKATSFSPSRIFNPRAYQSGGAGMAGTPNDLLKFFEALRTGGGDILRHETVALATRNQIGDLPRDPGVRFGYFGSIVADPAAAATPQSAGSYDWGGVYGHSWLVDPAQKLVMLSMSNTALEGCQGLYPRQVRDAIYADLL